MSDKNNRKWVRETLLTLPDKQRNKTLTGRLTRYAEIAEQSQDSLRSALALSILVKSVFSDSTFPNLAAKVRNAASGARSCQRDLGKGIEAVAKPQFEKRIVDIKEAANGSTKPVTEVWQANIIAGVRAYVQVAKIAADQTLPGGHELNKKLDELISRSSVPPCDQKDAATLNLKLASLPEDVTTLGLTGKAGDFLVAAAEGRGSPRDLENAEIRDLLDRYKLWNSLRVTLGSRT
jgi:hypothetical protein